MKKIIWAAILVCLGVKLGISQNIIGKVTDNTEVALQYVNVRVLEQGIGTITDNEGDFQLSLKSGNYKIQFTYMGFTTQILDVNVASEAINLNVILEEDVAALDEVVVSASREYQKRSEVPGSIGVISSKSIKETKAFGIDQLVNQVSGVFMSTSRVASNEQHFMAVRSPISTRALFLYLEDGLQIRPTSVFNHNALLEMNDVSYNRVEVLKGPASSIYGSESIGGSFNFITKNPTPELSGTIGFQSNDMGLTRYEAEVSNKTSDTFGFYLGSQFTKREDGPIEHSDYEKFAITFKTVYDISDKLEWTNVFDLIDYRSDMTGSLSEDDYNSGNFESDQTFTERDALAFRLRSTLTTSWNNNNKTAFNIVFRDNKMDQNPSYRVRQFRETGMLTGFGSGEVNSNQFNSYMALVQHKLNMNYKNSSLVFGGTIDYSTQDYIAETINVIVDPSTGRNIDFSINQGDFILNYEADIVNYAAFFQYEISPIDKLKFTAALRYDSFKYDYQNRIDGLASSNDSYDNWTPKLGANYNISNDFGVYANYSQGFTPPQVSTLYRNRNELRNIKPSVYDNFEIGTYAKINENLKVDGAIYLLNGRNTLISLRDEDDVIFNTNAGKTRSYGVEYGITFQPNDKWTIAHNGSYAKHRYVDFFENGVDYSDTDRETAPSLLGNTILTYKPFKDLSISGEYELVGSYNTSFEDQVQNDDGSTSTAVYDGHNVFNLRASYRFKNFEIWGHFLNMFDELYAARASFSRFRGENSYTIGNPRAVHFGVRIHF